MRKLFCLALMISASLAARATTYYITPTGSDSNACSQSSPCRTIPHVDSLLRPGDVVYLADGAYYYNSQITTTHSGTLTAPITWLSLNNWGAKIISTFGSGQGTVWKSAGNYVTIGDIGHGFDITGKGNNGIYVHGQYGVVRGNNVHDIPGACSQSSGGSGISFYNGYTTRMYGIADANYVHDIGKITPCPYVHGIYPSAPYVAITNNIVFNTPGYGLHAYHGAAHVTMVNNTVFHVGSSSTGGCIVFGTDSGSYAVQGGYVVANNICMNTGSHDSIRMYGIAGPGNLVTNNLLYNARPCSGVTCANTINGNPEFVLYTGDRYGDYHLLSNSPAKNAGVSTNAPNHDFDDRPRPGLYSGYDIGGYEYANQ